MTRSGLIFLGIIAAVLVAILWFALFLRPYDVPEYVEVDTSETAFVVPLEDSSGGQSKFQSVSYLEEKKVAAKRIQIPHRWNQTGRLPRTGEYLGIVRVIKVNRVPVTREWDGERDKSKGIWLESQDSVGFSTGFNCTAVIREEDAAKFLYWNRGGSLADVMDSEIRNRIMTKAFEVAQRYPLDELRSKKQEVIDAVRADVVPYFADRGITITMIGMYGGMTYENPGIQKAIDEVFIAQQEKDVNLARFEAQQKANERITLEAQAQAQKKLTEAKASADAKVLEAQGEAESLRVRAQAIQQTGQPIFQLRQLEIEQARVEKWDGKYPMYLFGAMPGNTSLMLNVPQPQPASR